MATTTRHDRSVLPMETAGTQHLVNRTYRESGPHQWARETYINASEAGATRVEFGIEWQAVASKGVYRRLIADNGSGMDPDELVEFFNTYGGGGKPIGGIHENFGVGAKTSLLPWNTYGVVVVSWVNGDPSMIWIHQHPESGEYGLKIERAEDPNTGEGTLEAVYDPYPDEDAHGCDWGAVKPDWIEDHGTVIVLLGGSPADNTVLGDPARDGVEGKAKGISDYLNRRVWEVPPEVKLTVDELRSTDPAQWPNSEAVGHGPQPTISPDRRTNRRRVLGAKYHIEYPNPSYKLGRLAANGTERLADGTEIDWYLWEGRRPDVHAHAPESGFIAALYKNELYNVTSHHATYRSFGIVENAVRQNVWLIIRPPELADSKHGIYPRNDRNALLLRGGPHAGGELPLTDWAGEFADSHMPDAIMDAISASRTEASGTLDSAQWRERLAERFGSRWRIPKIRVAKAGTLRLAATQSGTAPRITKVIKRKAARNTTPGAGGLGGATNIGSRHGNRPGERKNVAGGIPDYRAVTASELAEGMLAAWAPHDPLHEAGAVLLNVEHEVLRSQIAHWQSQYPDHWAEDIQREVIDAYGQIAVAKVAHSEFLKGVLPSKVVEEDLRSEAALTMSLLGLMAEESVLATRIGGKFSRKKKAA